MPTLSETLYGAFAVASVRAGANPSFSVQRGFQSVNRDFGSGLYTLVMTQPIDLNGEGSVFATLNTSFPSSVPNVEVVSPSEILLVQADCVTGNPTDLDFWIWIEKISP